MKKHHLIKLGRHHVEIGKAFATAAKCYKGMCQKSADDLLSDLADCFEAAAAGHAEIGEMCADLASEASDSIPEVENNADPAPMGSRNFEAIFPPRDLNKILSVPDSPLSLRGKTELRPEIDWNLNR